MSEPLLIVREEDIAEGRRYGYPECCIWWFAFVWEPVAAYQLFFGDAESIAHAARIFRGDPVAGYVQCPRCRKVER